MSLAPAHQSIIDRLDWERRHVPLGGEILEPVDRVVRMHAPDATHHVIIWSQLNSANADAVIAREIAWHRNLGVSFEWKVYSHDQPADLKERLAVFGFEIGEIESVMVQTAEAAARTGGRSLDSHTRVEVVRTPEQVQIFRDMAEQIFGGDWSFTAGQLDAGIEKNDLTHRGYIAFRDTEPASIGRLYVHAESEFAGLYGGGTLSSFRSQGLYRAVVQARIGDAIKWGAKYLMVDARESSRPILERLGFECIGETWPCVLGE